MRKDHLFSIVNKDIAVLPWGPEVIDITEVTIKQVILELSRKRTDGRTDNPET